MNIIYFTGNIGKDAETRSTKSGEVCSFSVAVQQGIGRDAPTEWYRCSIWGQRGSNLVTHLTKGAKVAVCGTLTIGEFEGKAQFNVNVLEIDPFCGGKRDGQASDRPTGSQGRSGTFGSGGFGGGSFGGSAPFDNDLDDDVPF